MPSSNKTFSICILMLGFVCFGALTAWAQRDIKQFHAIAYHGVVDSRDQLASDDVTLETLVNHFEWLVANNYNPVSIDQLIASSKGTLQLPDRAVLLCWDDGYKSFYTHVFPLLKAYKFPAVLALVGNWMNTPQGGQVQYGNELVPREKFLSWEQISTIAQSSLVEIASHSFDLHQGLLADRAGDMLPAAITHIYSPTSMTYESDAQVFERIRGDLQRNSNLIREKTGVSPRVMVWPFGRYNNLAVKAAKEAGMGITLTLDPVAATTSDLATVTRIYPTLNPETGSFKYSFIELSRPPLRRFIEVQTADLLEEDERQEMAFSQFLERVKKLAPGRVYFEPVVIEEEQIKTLFRNAMFPVIQDRLTRLTWHMNRRAGVEAHLIIDGKLARQFNLEDNRRFFSDIGKSSYCSGILIADETFAEKLINHPDIIPSEQFELPAWNPNQTRVQRKWLIEGSALGGLFGILTGLESLQQWQPFLDIGLLLPLDLLKTAPAGSLKNALRFFDYLMIDLRQAKDPFTVLKGLEKLENLDIIRPFLTMLVPFERKGEGNHLNSQLNTLLHQGIVDYGYAYDFFIDRQPDLETIKPLISTRTYPFVPE